MGFARLLRETALPGWLQRVLPRRGFATAKMGLRMLIATSPEGAIRRIGGSDRGFGSFRPRESDPSPPMAALGVRVALLEGCVQSGLFGHVNAATARVVRAQGAEVTPVRDQGCCGALHAHAGDLQRARTLARDNILAFEATGADRIVVNAAGCGAAMKEYEHLLEHDPAWAERAAAFASRVRDVSEWLVECGPRVGAPLDTTVAYDAPCHLVHAQGVSTAPIDVLRTIPGLDVLVPENAGDCCGGAGVYGITHAELGGRITRRTTEDLLETGAGMVTTANPGCIMQIGAALQAEGERRPVVHPVELLDESYRRAGYYGQQGKGSQVGVRS
jgi:glycolate oxidase iron-sulfur subunit